MADGTVNILVSTFTGLSLPRTLCLAVPRSTSIRHLRSVILSHLPPLDVPCIITTHCRKELSASSTGPVSSLLRHGHADLLPLRLAVPLRGGKGGFGSQLRAAGGRMASRKKRNQGETNGSSRNLDGRRLRTVTEAKALAEYLAIKPDMDKRQKEARRKRWEEVIQVVEEREEKIRQGSKGKLDGQWVDDKDEASERTREAVLKAMRSGEYLQNYPASLKALAGSGSEPEDEGSADEANAPSKAHGDHSSRTHTDHQPSGKHIDSGQRCFGFDNEDDDFISEEDNEEEQT